MSKKDSSKYIHGSSSKEQDRLSQLNTLLNRRCLNKLSLNVGNRVLDIGSGLGQLTRAMAKKVGSSGKIVGIERDESQFNKALHLAKADREAHLVDFRLGDALEIPLEKEEWNSFDWVHTRFVLEHLQNPQALVDVMMNACKSGGSIVLVDDDHSNFKVYPEPAGLAPLWEAYCRSYDRLGNDPYVGRRLVSLLHAAGAKQIETDMIYFGCTFDQEEFQDYAENLIGILEGAKDLILQQGLIQQGVYEKGIEGLNIWRKLPDATLWYAMNWARGRK